MTNETNQTTLFDAPPTNDKPTMSAPEEELPGYQFVKRVGWIPSDWKAPVLSDIADTHSGGTPSRGDDSYFGGEIPWIKSGEISDGPVSSTEETITVAGLANSSAKLVEPGTILVAIYGATAGVVGRSAIQAAINQALLAVLPRPSLNSEYLPYALRQAMPRVLHQLTQGGQPNLSGKLVGQIVLPLPPLPEQRKIARILSAWDRALADLDALLAAKRHRKHGLAQRLLTGRVRLPGFEADLVETKVGLIPSNWQPIRFGKVFKKRSEKNHEVGCDYVITVGKYAIRPQSEHFDKSVASADRSNYNVIRPGDFVYDPMSAYYGAIGRYDADRIGIVSPVYRVLTLRRGFDSDFLKHLLDAHYVRHRIASYSTQGNKEGKRRGLQHSAFNAIPVYLPTENEQRQIAAVLDAADAEIAALEAQRDALARQKRGLMQRLLTGAVRVTPDTEDTDNS